MGVVKDVVGGILGGGGGDEAAGAATDAANIQAQAQREALEYLKDTNAVPQYYKERSIRKLGKYRAPSTNELLKRAHDGKLYDALLAGQEEAALRARSATGGLRSGQAISDVGSIQNQALLQAYQNEANREQQNIANLQSLAGLGTNVNNIANMTAGIGQTQGQGIIAAQQNKQAAQQAGFGNLMGLGQLGIGGALAFSDERLKDNIEQTGEANGIPTFKWTWNKEAERFGLKGNGYGTLSKFVKQIAPSAVSFKDGYEQVNYDMIGVEHG